MELSAAMRSAATTRLFSAAPVGDDIIYRALDNARFAPSGGNRQGWRVIVVDDAATKAHPRAWPPGHRSTRLCRIFFWRCAVKDGSATSNRGWRNASCKIRVRMASYWA